MQCYIVISSLDDLILLVTVQSTYVRILIAPVAVFTNLITLPLLTVCPDGQVRYGDNCYSAAAASDTDILSSLGPML
jgi:hypothetical protein